MPFLNFKESKWRLVFPLLSLLIGATFIFSAFTKLFPIEFFELTFVEKGVAGWSTSPFIARIFIAVEFFIGLIFLFNLYTNKKIYVGTCLFLLALTVYLVFQIAQYGNTGNCGCFGNTIQFTPLEAIIKNIVLIAFCLLLYFFYPGLKFQNQQYIILIVMIAATSIPFILNPVDLNVSSHFKEEEAGYTLPLDIIYDVNGEKPAVDLRKGKWVLAYLSVTCPHCRIAAYKLHILKSKNPLLPIFFILNGKDKDFDPFFTETKSKDIPYIKFKGMDFLKMSGPELPAIFMIDDGVVVKKVNYFTLNQNEVENWIKE